MSPTVGLGRLAALAQEHPVAAALELGTLLSCAVLFVATLYAMVAHPPAESAGPWLAIVALGSAVVLLWTVVVPVYERLSTDETA